MDEPEEKFLGTLKKIQFFGKKNSDLFIIKFLVHHSWGLVYKVEIKTESVEFMGAIL